MSKASTGLRFALLALLCVSVTGLVGCTNGWSGAGGARTGAMPADLPAIPDPTKKYCKVWVPPVYRKVPKVVVCAPASMRTEEIVVNRTSAYEVMTKPAELRNGQTCGTDCEDSLVMVKPGGYRWETDGTCYQYKYRCPDYKWCAKKVQEDGIKYCYEIPAEYETVASTEQVTKLRDCYVPATYKTVWVEQVYTPGHWEWQSHAASECVPDGRQWRGPTNMGRSCAPAPKPAALDCGCARSN
jgi:hypothetical protein